MIFNTVSDPVVTDTPEANLQSHSGVTESMSGGCAVVVIGSQVSEILCFGFDEYLMYAFTNTLVEISW